MRESTLSPQSHTHRQTGTRARTRTIELGLTLWHADKHIIIIATITVPRPTAPSSPSTPAPTRMPIPFRRALNYFRASPLYCIARWRMAATPFCIASKFITVAAAEIETLPSIVCVQMYCLCVCLCVC